MNSGLYQHIFETKMADNKDYSFYNHDYVQELKTYHLNLGRQSGKTIAMLQTMVMNRKDFAFIMITFKSEYAREMAERYKTLCNVHTIHDETKPCIFCVNDDHSMEKAVLSLARTLRKDKRTVIFVDEPMRNKDRILRKISELNTFNLLDPIIFVIGEQ